ncbi:hypothetical protein V8C42DRAFT_180404 [Trichoderma barbatum]
MKIFETTIGDIDHVYISKDLPNQRGTITVPSFVHEGTATPLIHHPVAKPSFTACTDAVNSRISSITGRLNIVSGPLKSALRGGCSVQSSALSPCTFAVTIDKANIHLCFPVPMIASSCKTRIARKSGYVELVVPVVTDPARSSSSSLTYPVLYDGSALATWNMPIQIYPLCRPSISRGVKCSSG